MMARPRGARVKADAAPRRAWVVRLLRWTVSMSLLVAVIGAGVYAVRWAIDPHHLPIRSVQIEGEFLHLTTEQLQAAVADRVTGGFFTVNVHAVMQAAKTLPWVETASVRRIWPDAIRLAVTEQVPLARWGEAELINKRGERFAPAPDSFPPDLPSITGPDGLERAVVSGYYEMSKVLAPVGLRVNTLVQDPRRSWRLLLDNGIELKLGREDAYQRLLRFVRLYPRELAPQAEAIQAVDMRYTNGFAVSWKQPAAGTSGDRVRGG